MSGYAKLSSSLVHSTIWRESAETRVVWITMLALANQHGEVQASLPGLADASRVTVTQCQDALTCFLSPDPYSRTQDEDGRRIHEIPGGWFIINYRMYRDLYSVDYRKTLGRERQARHRAKKKAQAENSVEPSALASNDVTRDVTDSHGKSRQAVSSKAESREQRAESTPPSPPVVKESAAPATSRPPSELMAEAVRVTVALNAAIAERFGEQPSPIQATGAGPAFLIGELAHRGIPVEFAVREIPAIVASATERPRSPKYLLPGLERVWREHTAKADQDRRLAEFLALDHQPPEAAHG